MGDIWAPPTKEVVRRDPNDEGPGEWGCFYWLSDQVAAVLYTTGSLYDKKVRLFATLDKHLTQFVISAAHSQETVRDEVLKWLLLHAADLFDRTWDEWLKDAEENTAMTPSEKRDWFCYLYRDFKAWKADQ